MVRIYKKGEDSPTFKTGLAIHGQRPSLYNSWQGMKGRCLREKNPKYKRYGGRGIKVCEEWMNIEGFYDWALKSGWKEGLSIDRINNDGNYEPSNCRWISHSENSRKKRTTKISFEDATKIRERLEKGESEQNLANEYGVVHGTIWFIKNNFTHVEEGMCTKKLKNKMNN